MTLWRVGRIVSGARRYSARRQNCVPALFFSEVFREATSKPAAGRAASGAQTQVPRAAPYVLVG